MSRVKTMVDWIVMTTSRKETFWVQRRLAKVHKMGLLADENEPRLMTFTIAAQEQNAPSH